MSGGSYNYTSSRVEEEYVGRMFDKELNIMMYDLVKVLHDLEWWQSDDIGEEDYRKIVKEFKDKWLSSKNRNKRLADIITKEIEKTKQELMEMIGE